MAAGTGRMLASLLKGAQGVVVLAPRTAEDGEAPKVVRTLRFSGRGGGPLKIYSLLQHLEIILEPLLYALVHGRPRAVVCSQPLFSGVGGLLLKKALRVPLVVLGHGEEFSGAATRPGPLRWKYRLLKSVVDRADLLVLNSANTLQLAERHFAPRCRQACVSRPSVELAELADVSDEQRARAREIGGGQFVLMAGRLAQTHKGFDNTIRAFSMLPPEQGDVRLVIAGPDDPAALRDLAEASGVAARVVFTGPVERALLRALFAECEFFAMPGREVEGASEGFGVVFLEAGFYGKASLGGATGGVKEAVLDGETGILVDGSDVEAIRAGILRLLTDRQLADRLGQQAAQRVRSEFDSERSRREFWELLP